jgi:hydrogenase maturation factor HypE
MHFNGPLRIGGDSQFGEQITALISDVAIWNKALTETRIQALAAGGPVILATEDSAAEGSAAPQND